MWHDYAKYPGSPFSTEGRVTSKGAGVALQSQLFRGDEKLEAAAASDPAHVTPGAVGEHVKRIQLALDQLDHAHLLPDGIYGSRTAAAVLAYKQRRGIVNRTYQTTADNIVGKMTIAVLDREMFAQESGPALLQSVYPLPLPTQFPFGRNIPTGGNLLAFKVTVSASSTGGPSPMTDLVSAPVTQEVVVPPNGVGALLAKNFLGGVLILSEPPSQNTNSKIAKLTTGTNLRTSPQLDNADIISDPETFRYQSASECGIVKAQAVAGAKKSGIAEIMILVDKSSYTDEPLHPVDTTYASGVVSLRGTPLNPLQGRKINIFGRGESNGFENYSSSIPFCNDSGKNTKPWTNDPRKPSVGLENNSVKNICIRSSPIKQVTIDEIKRIAAQGCRVTYAEPSDTDFVKLMRKEFLDSGLARKPPVEDGPGKFGHVMVFEFK
jgi:peptidoglycan hydrolase-like protein with peptidoglycan-binding domain